MCQTFYKEHDKCTCIYLLDTFTPCTAYALAHPEKFPEIPQDPFADPEESPEPSNPFADPEDISADPVPETDSPLQAARAKLLIQTREGLDLTLDDTDYVSSDVDDSKAPKGVICPEGIITPTLLGRVEGEDGECPLCETPEVLERVDRIDRMRKGWSRGAADRKAEMAKGKEKERGKEKGIFHKTTRIGSAAVKSLKSVAGGKAKKEDFTAVAYATVGEGESSGSKSAENKNRKEEEKKEKPATWSMYNPAGPSMYNPMWGLRFPASLG